MLIKIHRSEEGNVYRFDYEGWEITVTSSTKKSELRGTAISPCNSLAPVYFTVIRRKNPSELQLDIARTVGELARQIAINFTMNCLDDFEDDGL
jgi:hypothetical protein